MTTVTKRLKTTGLTTALVMCVSMIGAANTATAGQGSPETGARKTTVAGKGASRFDWFATRATPVAKTRVIARVAAQGSGTWICSPAGFGAKSSCRRR